MPFGKKTLRDLILGPRPVRPAGVRRPRRVILNCDLLEGRVTPAHHGALQHAFAAVAAAHAGAAHHTAGSTTSTTTTTTTTNTALTTALQTLKTDVQKIESASRTTVGQLTAIKIAFQTLSSDGLSPSSYSALTSFENSLVTAAAGGTLAGNSTLLGQFEALYTPASTTLTTQQTADLTTAYNALAAAVTSANITSADITTINTDWAAVLAAENSTSTATYPYFNLVTGHDGGPGGAGCS
jgi:hypothetical protein